MEAPTPSANITPEESLLACRSELDALDAELTALLLRRMELARRAGNAKRTLERPLHDRAREAEVLDARCDTFLAGVSSLSGPARTCAGKNLRTVFRAVMTLCREAEEAEANLYFIGMSGSGKSTLGKLFAARCSRPFYDTDELVAAAAGCSIREIFDAEGESGFRSLEREALAKCSRMGGLVVATGGGILSLPENRRRIALSGYAVYLLCDENTLLAQDISSRPMLSCKEDVLHLAALRAPQYEACADLTLCRETLPVQLDKLFSFCREKGLSLSDPDTH